MPAGYLPSFTQARVLDPLYGRYRLAKTRWGAGHGWCLGIYTHKDMHDVLEVETNWGLRKHGLANLILEPFW